MTIPRRARRQVGVALMLVLCVPTGSVIDCVLGPQPQSVTLESSAQSAGTTSGAEDVFDWD